MEVVERTAANRTNVGDLLVWNDVDGADFPVNDSRRARGRSGPEECTQRVPSASSRAEKSRNGTEPSVGRR